MLRRQIFQRGFRIGKGGEEPAIRGTTHDVREIRTYFSIVFHYGDGNGHRMDSSYDFVFRHTTTFPRSRLYSQFAKKCYPVLTVAAAWIHDLGDVNRDSFT